MTEQEYLIIKNAGDAIICLIMQRSIDEDRDLTEEEQNQCKRIVNKMTAAELKRARTVAEETSRERYFAKMVHGRSGQRSARARTPMRTPRFR